MDIDMRIYASSVAACFVLSCSCSLVNAEVGSGNVSDDARKVGRYALVTPSATPSQVDLLSVVVDVSFDSGIATVGDALQHLLARSGFSLADLDSSDPFLPILYSRPLPQVHRHIGPIHLNDALIALAGPAWLLTVDPVNRLISYELLKKYRPSDTASLRDDGSPSPSLLP